jgi:CheY-like chemotaxis protein
VPGKGSTFDLILPLATAPRPVAAPERAAAGKRDLRSAGPFRVLVAEDQATNRFLIQRQLAQLGVEADMAEDGRAALALYEQRPYALLITDCHMPEMDGIELTAQIRSREPAGAHLPIVGLTADVTPEISQRCRAAGMDELLTKPTRIGQLEEMLRALLLTSSGAERERADSATDDIDFDSAMFDELFAGSEREGFDWLEQYLVAAEGLLDTIADHVADGDKAALAAAAHRLAGISLSVGAHRLGHLCQRLEHSAKAGSATPPPPLMTEMRVAFASAAAAIGTLRQSHGAMESTS